LVKKLDEINLIARVRFFTCLLLKCGSNTMIQGDLDLLGLRQCSFGIILLKKWLPWVRTEIRAANLHDKASDWAGKGHEPCALNI
jgi:hypothetical protein